MMDWTKWGAVAGIAGSSIAAIALVRELSSAEAKPWVIPAFVAAVIACLTCVVILFSINKVRTYRQLPLQLLLAECQDLLQAYRRLAFDFKDDVRYPLNNSSWPDYGHVWEYRHVQLVVLKARLFPFLFSVSKIKPNYAPDGNFGVEFTNSILIVDLISKLEELATALKRDSYS